MYEITNLPTGTQCWGNYTIVNPDCNNDVHAPYYFEPPPSLITISCNGTLPSYNLVAYDDCDNSICDTESTFKLQMQMLVIRTELLPENGEPMMMRVIHHL
ncbi:MAG: hypothetical protein R2769_17655 [Saprospiraceae bacterium]